MKRPRAEYSPPPPPPLTKPEFVDHSDTSITIKVDGGDSISIEYNKLGSITKSIDATILPFFGGICTCGRAWSRRHPMFSALHAV